MKHSQGPFDWSHGFDGTGDRCDGVPALNQITDYWECLICGARVMTNLAAEANNFLVTNAHGKRVFRRPPSARPPSIPGFVWTGTHYERIAAPDPNGHKIPYIRDAPSAYHAPSVRAGFVLALVLVLALAGALSMCTP